MYLYYYIFINIIFKVLHFIDNGIFNCLVLVHIIL